MKRAVAVLLFFSVLLLQVNGAAVDWIDSQRVGERIYFLHISSPRIEIYDLEERQWMPSVALNRIPTAFYIDEDELFIAYENIVYRYGIDGSNEFEFSNCTSKVRGMFADGDLLFIFNDDVESYEKQTGDLIDSTSSDILVGISCFKETNTFYGCPIGISSPRINQGTYDGAGKLLIVMAQFNGVRDRPTETFLWPDGGRVSDTSGRIYDGISLKILDNFISEIDDLAFRGGDIPIVLYDNVLHAYSNTIQETGSKALGVEARSIYTSADDVAVFYTDDNSVNGMGVKYVDYDEIDTDEPGQPMEPDGFAFTPDDAFIDKNDVIHLLSQAHFSIFRFDTNTQEWLERIPLRGGPEYFAYSHANNRIYTAYLSGKVFSIDLNEGEPTETIFADLTEAPQGMVAAGQYLVTSDSSGHYMTRKIWDSNGVQSHFKSMNQSLINGVWNETLGIIHTGLNREFITIDGKFSSESTISYDRSLTRVKPDGSIFILGDGLIYDASTSLQVDRLSQGIGDATWLGDQLFTLCDGSVVQWLMPTYAKADTLSLPGQGLRVFSTSNDKLALLYLDSAGFTRIGLFDESYDLIAPSVLEAPVLILERHSAMAVTLEWQNVSGEEEYLLERKTGEDGEWSQVATIGMDATRYTDNTVVAGNMNYYRLKASNNGILSPNSNEVMVDLNYGPLDADPVKVPSGPFTPDAAFVDNGSILYLLQKSQQILYRWDINRQTWIKGIDLQQSPHYVTYSEYNHAVYTVHGDGKIFKISLSDFPLVEVPFASLESNPRGLLAAGEYIIGSEKSVYYGLCKSFAPDGMAIDTVGETKSLGGAVWSDINRRFYHFRDGTVPNSLNWTGIAEDGSFSGYDDSPHYMSEFFQYPIRVKPDGSIVVLGNGRIFDAASLEQINMLPNSIVDATWIGGSLYALEDDSIINYTLPDYAAGPSHKLSGMSYGIFATPEDELLAISISSKGMPVMDVLDADCQIIIPEVLAVPALKVAGYTSDEVFIEWSDVSGEAGYVVERQKNESSAWIEIGSTGPGTTQFRDSSVFVDSVYQYRVKAMNGGKESGYSNSSEAALLLPDQVMSLTAIADSETQVTLAWDDVEYESEYVVKRTSQGQTSEIALLAENTVEYVDETLVKGTAYEYSVLARNVIGNAEASPFATVTTPVMPPIAPESLAANVLSAWKVQLSWIGVGNVDTYEIDRALRQTQDWSRVAVLPFDATSYVDASVEPGAAYIYRVTASNAGGSSSPEVTGEVRTPEIAVPEAPEVAVGPKNGTGVLVRWEAGLDVESYDIYRRETGEVNFSLYGTVDGSSTSFVDAHSEAGHQYEYTVVAVNRVGRSSESNILVVEVFDGIDILVEDFEQEYPNSNWAKFTGISLRSEAPGNSTHVGYLDGNLSRLIQTRNLDFMDTGSVSFQFRAGNEEQDGDDWKNSAVGKSVYLEYYEGTEWIALAELDTAYPSHQTWEMHTIEIPSEIIRTIESLRWRQISFGSDSDQWAIDNIVISTRILLPPDQPALVVAGSNSNDKVGVFWQPVPHASYYIVERSHDDRATWNEVAVVTDPEYYFLDSGLNPKDRYYYRISAGNSKGISRPTNSLRASQLTALQKLAMEKYFSMEAIVEIADSFSGLDGNANVMSYALDLDSNRSVYTVDLDEPGVGELAFAKVNENQVMVSFNRRKKSSNPEIQYLVYIASGLNGPWIACGDLEIIRSIDNVWETVQWTSPIVDDGNHFFRLVVKTNE